MDLHPGGIDDTVGVLFDGNGRQITYNDDSLLSENPSHFYIWVNLGPGTYYIAVAGYDATITGPYSLHTRTAADQGGTVDVAATLTLGEPVDGIIGPSWEEDVYRIDLSTATGPTDLILYTTGDVDTTGELVDENLREVEYGDDSILSEQRSNFFLGSVLEPGVYYIFVSGLFHQYRALPPALLDRDRPGLVPRNLGGPGPGVRAAWHPRIVHR